MIDNMLLSYWGYYSAPEVELYAGEYTYVLLTYSIDHAIDATSF